MTTSIQANIVINHTKNDACVVSKQYPNDLFHKDNFAIAASYFSVGFVGAFMATPLNIYLVEVLNAEPGQQNTISILQSLPWSLKLLFGFLSDTCPIRGMHRKPYLSMGALIYSSSSILYAVTDYDNILFLAATLFISTLGLICFDVMADTMCVERSKFEESSQRGQMQASCYSIRFFGSLIGAFLGTAVCNQKMWGWGLDFKQVCFINGLIPVGFIMPFLFFLREKYPKQHVDKFANDINAADASSCENEHLISKSDSTMSKGYKYQSLNTETRTAANSNKPLVLSIITTQPTNDVGTIPTKNENNRDHDHNDDNSLNEEDEILLELQPFGPGARKEMVVGSRLKHSPKHHGSHGHHSHPPNHFSNKSNNLDEHVYEYDNHDESGTARSSKDGHDSDDEGDEPLSVSRQLADIWDTVQLHAVWKPMAFVYIYNVLQVPNVAWQSYLQLSLHFEPWILGLTATLGCLMTLLGVLAYKYLFFRASWKAVYAWSTVLTAFFSLMQLVLIFRVNEYFHVSNYFFSLGDDIISAYISGVQFLPVCIMYMRLCPDGSEGASYSMLTTFGNIALVCASNIGNLLSGVRDVFNSAMRSHDISGLWKLTILTSCLSVTPLLFLGMLPTDSDEQERSSRSKAKSKLGGAVFLVVLFSSLLWTIVSSVLSLVSNISQQPPFSDE